MAKYDKNCDISTIYLGTSSLRRQDEVRTDYRTLITEDCYIW